MLHTDRLGLHPIEVVEMILPPHLCEARIVLDDLVDLYWIRPLSRFTEKM